MMTVPALTGTPPSVVDLRASRKSTLVGLCNAQGLFDERSDQRAVRAQSVLQFRPVAEDLNRRAEQFGDGLLAGAEEECRRSDDFE